MGFAASFMTGMQAAKGFNDAYNTAQELQIRKEQADLQNKLSQQQIESNQDALDRKNEAMRASQTATVDTAPTISITDGSGNTTQGLAGSQATPEQLAAAKAAYARAGYDMGQGPVASQLSVGGMPQSQIQPDAGPLQEQATKYNANSQVLQRQAQVASQHGDAAMAAELMAKSKQEQIREGMTTIATAHTQDIAAIRNGSYPANALKMYNNQAPGMDDGSVFHVVQGLDGKYLYQQMKPSDTHVGENGAPAYEPVGPARAYGADELEKYVDKQYQNQVMAVAAGDPAMYIDLMKHYQDLGLKTADLGLRKDALAETVTAGQHTRMIADKKIGPELAELKARTDYYKSEGIYKEAAAGWENRRGNNEQTKFKIQIEQEKNRQAQVDKLNTAYRARDDLKPGTAEYEKASKNIYQIQREIQVAEGKIQADKEEGLKAVGTDGLYTYNGLPGTMVDTPSGKEFKPLGGIPGGAQTGLLPDPKGETKLAPRSRVAEDAKKKEGPVSAAVSQKPKGPYQGGPGGRGLPPAPVPDVPEAPRIAAPVGPGGRGRPSRAPALPHELSPDEFLSGRQQEGPLSAMILGQRPEPYSPSNPLFPNFR